MSVGIAVEGFLDEGRRTAIGALYRGRLSLGEVQWTGKSADTVATVTLTLAEVADAAESRMLWTDQDVQRGIQPTAPSGTPKRLPLANGYPDSTRYIFDAKNADDIVDKLLTNQKLFLNPLVWNLRPGQFAAFWNSEERELIIYDGEIFLPDSHHRHQAILKAVRAYKDSPKSYPQFDPNKQVKIEIYFLSRADEGNYFFDKNQRPRSTALSKAFDLTTDDDLSVLAKRVLELTPQLDRGTNRATDRLSKKAPHFVTLSTLREAMRTFAGSTEVEETELNGMAYIASEFFKLLMRTRPELGVATSHVDRDKTLAASAVMMHGYAALMRAYNADVAELGLDKATSKWSHQLQAISPSATASFGNWTGDFLSKDNPLWLDLGVTRRDPHSSRLGVGNTGGTRARAGEALLARVQG